MKHNIYATIGVASIALMQSINAQSINEFQNKLEFERSENALNSGEVTIRIDDSARIALAELESQTTNNTIEGYRIGVFFDNGATARTSAAEVVTQCEKLFPDIPITMSYDNPYFKVSAGYCVDSEEAIMMLNRIQKHFPKAYLMREQISPKNIITSRDKEIESKNRASSTTIMSEEAEVSEISEAL